MAAKVFYLFISLFILLFLFEIASNQDTETQTIVEDTLQSSTELDTESISTSEISSSDQTLSSSPSPNCEINNVTTNTTTKPVKPVCTPETGCTPPLYCLNISSLLSFSNYTNVTEIFEQGRVIKVSSNQLAHLLDSPLFTNSCLLVMYYAVWCPYSIQFMPTYRRLGRVFPSQLTAVALDFGEKNQEKFLLAYLPRVLFYYSGRAVYDMDTSLPLEQLTKILTNITRLVPIPLDSIPELEEEQESGLPTEWIFDSTWYYISITGIVIIISVHLIKRTVAIVWLTRCRDMIRNFVSKIKRD